MRLPFFVPEKNGFFILKKMDKKSAKNSAFNNFPHTYSRTKNKENAEKEQKIDGKIIQNRKRRTD